MHARASDELSRLTTALSSAPIILVTRRPFTHSFISKRRIVDTPLSSKEWLGTTEGTEHHG